METLGPRFPLKGPFKGNRSIDIDGCQNYGPLLGPRNIRCRIILKGPKIMGSPSTPLYTCHLFRNSFFYYNISIRNQ